jgi:homoserine dehydrogenase
MDVVMASKGPLVRAYAELAARSDLGGNFGGSGPRLRFSGAVGGALASINLGRRDLAGGRIARVEAVLNATTQVILELRARGLGAAEALAEAQRLGIAEPDARLDLEGWDAASKLVILANAALGRPTRLGDVAVRGIVDLEDELLRAAAGGRVSLLATAEASGGSVDAPDWRLTVAPTVLAAGHPLARLVGGELGVVFESDVFGRTVLTSRADGPIGTAAAMLRDVIEVAAGRG